MLIYVDWKIDLNKNNKVNILRISLNKNPDIKYEISSRKYLLGSQIVGIGEEFNQDQIYFTRVKIGSGNKITNENTIQIQMFVFEKHTQIEKSINIYLAGTKAALTSNLKELYFYSNCFGINNETFNNKLKELKKYGVTDFTNLLGDRYIFSVGIEEIN